MADHRKSERTEQHHTRDDEERLRGLAEYEGDELDDMADFEEDEGGEEADEDEDAPV